MTIRVAITVAAACLLAGCAAPSLVDGAGLDFGRRYAWTKANADDVERRRAIYICAAAEEEDLRAALMVQSVPFLGLVALPATIPTVQTIMERRARCMEAGGWTLIDLVSGAPQQIERDSWGDVRPTPRGPVPEGAR